MRSTPWKKDENEALVRLYFDMLECASAGSQYNKAGMIRSYQFTDDGNHAEILSGRSRGSIEFKLMNATAAHADILAGSDDNKQGASDYLLRTMHGHGYRAMPNYQAGLLDPMRTELGRRGNEQWAHRA